MRQRQRGGKGREGTGAGHTGPVGRGGDFQFYSRGVKFSLAERTNQAALPHKDSVFGGLNNTSRFLLETEPGGPNSSRAGFSGPVPHYCVRGQSPLDHREQHNRELGVTSDLGVGFR